MMKHGNELQTVFITIILKMNQIQHIYMEFHTFKISPINYLFLCLSTQFEVFFFNLAHFFHTDNADDVDIKKYEVTNASPPPPTHPAGFALSIDKVSEILVHRECGILSSAGQNDDSPPIYFNQRFPLA